MTCRNNLDINEFWQKGNNDTMQLVTSHLQFFHQRGQDKDPSLAWLRPYF
jgi:hypothetical protein